MIQLSVGMRVFVAIEPPDFRLGIDGLANLCEKVFDQNPLSGALFVFRNKRCTAVKMLVHDGASFWLIQRRLASGKLAWWPTDRVKSICLETRQLAVLLSDGDPSQVRFKESWKKKSRALDGGSETA